MRWRLVPVILAVAGLATTHSSAATWPPLDMTEFVAACEGHTAIQAMVADVPASTPPAITQLCDCLADSLDGISQADADILTGDLRGTTTDAERRQHEGYGNINERARTGLDACLANENVPDAPAADEATTAAVPDDSSTDTVAEAEPTVTTNTVPPVPDDIARGSAGAAASGRRGSGFLSSCVGSAAFRDYLAKISPADSQLQGTICSCMTGALRDEVSDDDFVILQSDFAPEQAPARDPSRDYQPLAQAAQSSLRSCMAEVGISANF